MGTEIFGLLTWGMWFFMTFAMELLFYWMNDNLFKKCWSLKLNWNLEPFIYQTYIVNTTIFSPNVGGLDRIQTWNLSFTKLTYYILLIFILVIVLLSTTGSVRNLHTLKHIGVETRQAIPHFWLGLCNKWEIFSWIWITKFVRRFLT